MSLLWALPVFVLVAGVALAGVLLGRLTVELGELDRSLRRAGRVGVAAGELRRGASSLHRAATRLAGRVDERPGPDPDDR